MAIDSRTSGAIGGAAQGAAYGSAFGAVGTAIGGIAGGLAGLLGGGGESEARKLARMQVKMIRLEAAEQERRRLREMSRQLGHTRAAIAASNVLQTGSAARYTNEMEAEYRRQLAYDRYAARQQERMARKGADVASSQIQAAGIGTMIQGFGSLGAAGARQGWFSAESPQPTDPGAADRYPRRIG